MNDERSFALTAPVCVAPTFDRPETVIVVDVDDLFPSAGRPARGARRRCTLVNETPLSGSPNYMLSKK